MTDYYPHSAFSTGSVEMKCEKSSTLGTDLRKTRQSENFDYRTQKTIETVNWGWLKKLYHVALKVFKSLKCV